MPEWGRGGGGGGERGGGVPPRPAPRAPRPAPRAPRPALPRAPRCPAPRPCPPAPAQIVPPALFFFLTGRGEGNSSLGLARHFSFSFRRREGRAAGQLDCLAELGACSGPSGGTCQVGLDPGIPSGCTA